MPRISTYPTLYDSACTINITRLKKWNYLKSNQVLEGVLSWTRTRTGETRAKINVLVNTKDKTPYLEVDYLNNGEPRNYKINLVRSQSNLNKGDIWYFICPKTKKKCRNLYLIGGYFLHREAFKGCFYESQTQSKNLRQIESIYGDYFKYDRLYSELRKKHFKRTYRGVPTKKYTKLSKRLREADSIKIEDIERIMMTGKV